MFLANDQNQGMSQNHDWGKIFPLKLHKGFQNALGAEGFVNTSISGLN